MDALTLLQDVSDAYHRLQTLEIEATLIAESGDENANHRTEHRVRFFYAAPNLTRYETAGKNGRTQVSDGQVLHTCFPHPHHASINRYHSAPATEILHMFRSDRRPLGGAEPFLFQTIHQHVTSAEILRRENGCHVISVRYEPPQRRIMTIDAPVLFWVSAENHLVLRQQIEVSLQARPTLDEISRTLQTTLIRKIRLNETLPEDTFQFTPPPDAHLEAMPTGRRFSLGTTSGFIKEGTDGHTRLEHQGSHEWDGDTLVEHSRWSIRGKTLHFERRLSFSSDEKELNVTERITSPQQKAETSQTLRVG